VSTFVYRLFDADDRLLYVGISCMPGMRVSAHKRRRWGHLIARVEAGESYPTEAEARTAEKRAIETEDPTFNIVHSPRRLTSARIDAALEGEA
jgi:hypothetical protein